MNEYDILVELLFNQGYQSEISNGRITINRHDISWIKDSYNLHDLKQSFKTPQDSSLFLINRYKYLFYKEIEKAEKLFNRNNKIDGLLYD